MQPIWRALLRRVFRGAAGRPPASSSTAASASTPMSASQRASSDALHDAARRVSAGMAPWERAQMDAPSRPLSPFERLYWRLFAVFGSVGLIYEVFVLENRQFMPSVVRRGQLSDHTPSDSVAGSAEQNAGDDQHARLIRGNHGTKSHVFLEETNQLADIVTGEEGQPN